jgi:putative glycosyltransferase (TIGR04372 family)
MLKYNKLLKVPFYIFAIIAVLIIRILKPWIIIRVEVLFSNRIGHFIGNTELYLCEKDANINVPNQRHLDIFYISESISNKQLAVMWKRVLRIWPSLIMAPIYRVNRLIPGGKIHEIGQNTQAAVDVHNLLDKFPAHLQFTKEEELIGIAGLKQIGILNSGKFVCLNVRDSAYLSGPEWDYHSYRDSNILNFALAADTLAKMGYYVIRMGAKVHSAIKCSHPRVIDYAFNGLRSDFMDIYLGANCVFCISTGTGWDTVPQMFRRPIVYVNMVPLGDIATSRSVFLTITKKHICKLTQKQLSFRDIFSSGVGFCWTAQQYESKNVELTENSPEEICEVALEMEARLNGAWQTENQDEELQSEFWDIFRINAKRFYTNNPIHGEIRGRFGAAFLRKNKNYLLG